MILIRADANSNIGMGHVMRTLSIADALSSDTSFPTIISGKKDIKFVLADEMVADLIKSRGYEPIVLHTDYSHMEDEIEKWTELEDSIDADLIIVDSYFVTADYLSWLKENIGFTAYIDDVLSFPYPVDVLVDYNAYATEESYHALYGGKEEPELIIGPSFAPLRSMFQDVPPKEQREEVKDVLLSTGGSDELHIAANFVQYLCELGTEDKTYHILLGAMNTDKEEIKALASGMDRVIIHENVQDMRGLICSMDVIVSAAGSTLYEICACGVPLITFSTADNQFPGATAFSSLGLAINIGDLREPESRTVMSGTLAQGAIKKIVDAVDKLDKNERIEMVTKQRKVIDGHGASRLAKKLLSRVSKNIKSL